MSFKQLATKCKRTEAFDEGAQGHDMHRRDIAECGRMTIDCPRLRIGFITSVDPLNRRSWSGIPYSVFHTLERNLGKVVALGPVSMRWPFAILDRVNSWIVKPATGKRYQYGWSITVSRWYAFVFGRKLARQHFDLLVAPASFTEIAYLRSKVPIVYIEDSTLCQLMDFYPGLTGLLAVSKAELNHIGAARTKTSEPGLLLIRMGRGVGPH